MPPVPQPHKPRIVIYYQTQHNQDGTSCSILPIIAQPDIAVTHINVAAIHLNDPPGHITLNDHVPADPRYVTLWAELRILQASGVKVCGMLGGAGKGSFTRLDLDEGTFEAYYLPLRDLVRERGLDGLDLDVEEEMSLAGIIRLIDRLKADFGPQFIITLAPVAAALVSEDPRHNLSGFNYEALEVMRGSSIDWYNTQFYCGWGDMSKTDGYDFMVARGWDARKIVIGVVTNPGNGAGFVPFPILKEVLLTLRERYPGFGGVMGWEYFNSKPGDREKPWLWAQNMTRCMRRPMPRGPPKHAVTSPTQAHQTPLAKSGETGTAIHPTRSVDGDDGDAPVPKDFEYFTDEGVE